MSGLDWLLLGFIGAYAAFVLLRKKKKSCCGNCSGCSGCTKSGVS